MINFLTSFILLTLFFYPTLLIVNKLKSHKLNWDKVIIWFIFSSTAIPLYIFYLNHFAGIPLNQKNIFLSLLVLNFILFFVFKYIPIKKKKISKEKLSKKEKYIYIFSSLITILYFGFPYIFKAQPIIGGDTPHYLLNSTILIQNQFPQLVFDRSIVYFFPAIISIITHIPIEAVMKLYIAAYELIFILISLSFAKKFISTRLLLSFTIALIFSPATYIMSKFTIAFFIAITILYYLIYQISLDPKNIYKNLLLPIFWGLLFNLHGIVAFSSLIIIPSILIYQSIINKINLKKYIFWIILFFTTSQPLITTQWSRINAGVVQPIISSFNIDTIDKKEAQIAENKINSNERAATKESRWVDEFTTNKSKSLKDFPLNKDSFTSSFLIPTLIFSILGIILILSNFKYRKKTTPILVTTFIFFLLTQQQYFGMEWFPIRYIFAMGPLIYFLAFYYFDKISKSLKKPVVMSFVALIAIILPTVFVGAKKISTLSANINPVEYSFIKNLNQFIKKGDVIFVGAADDKWIQTLIPDSLVFQTDHRAICNDESAKNRMLKQRWETSKAFSTSITLDESINIFKEYSQEQPYFVYLDTKNYHCINGKLFPASEYTILDQQEGYIFLKYNQ